MTHEEQIIKRTLDRFNLESNINVVSLYKEQVDNIFNLMTDANVESVSKELGLDRDVLEIIVETFYDISC